MHLRGVYNKWMREGNFFYLMDNPHYQRTVMLNYLTPRITILRSVQIHQDELGVSAYFCYSPFHKSILLDMLREAFGDVTICDRTLQVSVGPDFMTRLARLINRRSDSSEQTEIREQFTPDIIDELQTIVTFLRDPTLNLQHKLPEIERVSKAYVNPACKKSDALTRLLMTYNGLHGSASISNEKLGKHIHQLLIRGHDPQQTDDSGESPLTQIIILFGANLDLIKLFLMYGVNPFFCESYGYNRSPIEAAYQHGRHQAVDFFISTTIRVEKPLSRPNPLLSVDTLAGNDMIITSFRFAAGSLVTTLKPALNLTEEELAGLYRVSRQRGDSDKGFQLIYAREPNKFVDIIRHEDGEIVGSVVYKVRMVKDKLWVNIDFEVFSATHLNFGIMPVITYRFPFSLQYFHPDTEIWMVFFAADYSSFRRIKHEAAVPKLQPEGKVSEIVDTMRNAFNSKFQFIFDENDTTVCSVIEDDPVVIKGEEKSATTDVMEELFWRFRGDKNDRRRDVLVSLPVAADFLRTLQIIAAGKEVNFYRIVRDLSDKLSALGIGMNRPRGSYQPGFFDTSQLFWQGQKVPVDLRELANKPRHKPGLRANL